MVGRPMPTLQGCLEPWRLSISRPAAYSTNEQSDPQRNLGSFPQWNGQRYEDRTGLLISTPTLFLQHTLGGFWGVRVDGKKTVSRSFWNAWLSTSTHPAVHLMGQVAFTRSWGSHIWANAPSLWLPQRPMGPKHQLVPPCCMCGNFLHSDRNS